jgi:hypothetical protein
MQEFWFCATCKSMNRGDTIRCYKCRAPKEQATLATVNQRPQGVVLTPGLDDEHREVAWTLMSTHTYISAWRLGYVAAALLILFPVLLVLALVANISVVVGNGLLDPTRLESFQMDPNQASSLSLLDTLVLLSALAAIVVHSGFLALTSMNTSALGSGQAKFGVLRAALWYVESTAWVIWGWMALVLPFAVAVAATFFVIFGVVGLIVGGIQAVVWFVCARWMMNFLGGPIASIGKPRRLLQDLMDRLGVPGNYDSRYVGLWSTSWATARTIEYLDILSPVLLVGAAIVGSIVASMMGGDLTPASPSDARLYGTVIGVLAGSVYIAAVLFGFILQAAICVQLSKRQRIREQWVVGGYRDARAKAAAPKLGLPPMPRFAATQPGYAPQPGPATQPGSQQQPGMLLPTQTPAPSPVGAQPLLPIPTELPPDDMTPDWSRPVFSTKAPVEPPPVWSQTPVIPTSPNRPMPPAWSRAPQPFAPQSFAPPPPDDLPDAWRRAVQQSGPTPTSPAPFERQPAQPPAAPAGQDVAPADRPTIQPSAASLSRYRPSMPPTAPEPDAPPPPAAPPPADDPSIDHDLGQGI